LAAGTGTGEFGFAARYGAALYDLAFEEGKLDLVVEQMAALGRLIAETPDLQRLIGNPLTSAQALTDTQRNQLRARLTESGFGNVRLAESVDPSLLGGLVLKIGTRLYDTSLKSRLSRLNYSLKGAA
jgi:F-type H+-transporting ATPase subunit delta